MNNKMNPFERQNVQTPPEFGEISYVILVWTPGFFEITLRRLISLITQAGAEIIVVVQDEMSQKSLHTMLSKYDLSMDKIHFMEFRFDARWVRDYAPQVVHVEDKSVLISWEYNLDRNRDNKFSYSLADYLKCDHIKLWKPPLRFFAAGGNFMTDGDGTAIVTDLAIKANPDLSEHEVNTVFKKYFGIDNLVILPAIRFDLNNHIDMYMKFLAPDTIMVGEYPEGKSDHEIIEQNVKSIQNNVTNRHGKSYKIVRIPMPPEDGLFPSEHGLFLSYINSLIVNKTVIVPLFGYESDNIALDIYRKAMPDYTVEGMYTLDILKQSGGIHCMTKEVNVLKK